MDRNIFRKNISLYFTLTLVVFLSTLILWLPFLTKSNNWFGLNIQNSDFLYIYKHYDGPLYIIAAKSLYDPKVINSLGKQEGLPSPGYFAAHLPLYPLIIKGIRDIGMIGGYLKSMVFVNLLSTLLLTLFLFYFLKKLKLTEKPLLLTIIFLFLPRFLVIRSIGAPESLFIFLILLSLFFFEKKNYFLAGLFGGLSVATKTPGILLFPAYGLVLLEQYLTSNRHSGLPRIPGFSNHRFWSHFVSQNDFSFNWQWLFLLLIPLGLLGVFVLYGIQYRDFFAYFHSGDNIHLVSPFSVFNSNKAWVGTAWLEEVIFYFFLYLLTVLNLKNIQYRSLFYFSLVFFIALVFVQHRDISRYSLPLWPMALIAFGNFFTSKNFLLTFIILLPAIYLYAWNFLSYNIMPISNWAPFM